VILFLTNYATIEPSGTGASRGNIEIVPSGAITVFVGADACSGAATGAGATGAATGSGWVPASAGMTAEATIG
jgi:hypothetical protein